MQVIVVGVEPPEPKVRVICEFAVRELFAAEVTVSAKVAVPDVLDET